MSFERSASRKSFDSGSDSWNGTLIESEQLWRDVRSEFVTAHGGRWSEDAQVAMIGMRTAEWSQEWSQYIHDELGVALAPSAIAEQVVETVVERVSQRVPVLPGAAAALERLAGTFVLGLATSATLVVAQTVLAKTGWDARFAVVVSADAVSRGKPAPDVYLRALALLEADPSRTAAIEDSGNGIRSAHAAQLHVVAILNRSYPPDADALSLAERVLASLDDLDVLTIRHLLQ